MIDEEKYYLLNKRLEDVFPLTLGTEIFLI